VVTQAQEFLLTSSVTVSLNFESYTSMSDLGPACDCVSVLGIDKCIYQNAFE